MLPPLILLLLKSVKCALIKIQLIQQPLPLGFPKWLCTPPHELKFSAATTMRPYWPHLELLWQFPIGGGTFLFPLPLSLPNQLSLLYLFLKEGKTQCTQIFWIDCSFSQDCPVKWILITANRSFSEKLASDDICNSLYSSSQVFLAPK